MNASFSPETEAQAREMMRLVQLAFLRRLPALKWMTSADKMKAADKLTGMVRSVASAGLCHGLELAAAIGGGSEEAAHSTCALLVSSLVAICLLARSF